MKYLTKTVNEGIVTLTMNAEGREPWGTPREEHRLSPGMVSDLSAAIDEIERDDSVKAVILRGAGKFWSNGVDLGWMKGKPIKERETLQKRTEALLARILTLPVPTVAELNGHTAAAGAMLALTFDTRVMNKERGFFFVPAVNIGLVYTPGMTALMKAKTPQPMHNSMIVQASRYTADQLLVHGVVSHAVAPSSLPSLSRDVAVRMSSREPYPALRQTMGAIKTNLYKEAHTLLVQSGVDMGFSKL
eukprot:TRINITY_DN12711_c0_g1_i1.p1 TRINITY_DN12711_c0_g1~~TRINITY_DN12711_c0_g1_i1.p1  ORF type:complete len:246 (+),score=39.45 TRINITY_DN12711_c0_g1_i1:69-806(+)